ncbi:MAG: hypothetical protein ACJAS2_001182 [Pseudohongiellaceae bacterium]
MHHSQIAHLNTPLRQQVIDITLAEVELVAEPNGVLDDFTRESVALVHF